MQPLVVKYGGSSMHCRVTRTSTAVVPSLSTAPEDALRTGSVEGDASRPLPDFVLQEIAQLHKEGARVVLVHGGGPEIDQALAQRGIATQRVAGHRVTDAATLEVVESVLCGTINKRLVRSLLALGIRAVGISGQDGPTLIAEEARGENGADLGFVGEIADCDGTLVQTLLDAGALPVIAPLAISRDGAQAYNVNADLAAAAIAASLQARAFVVVTNVPRVLRDADDPSSGIDALTAQQARDFASTDACRSSMKPKMLAAAAAVAGGVSRAYICDTRPGAITAALSSDATVISST
jgi:acetylglutamate kinase